VEKNFVRHGRKGELCDHQPDTCHVFIQWQDPDAGARLGIVDDAASWLRTGGWLGSPHEFFSPGKPVHA
jgi:hypothetical protein